MTFLAFHNFYVLEPNLDNESFLDNLDPVGFGFGSQKSYLHCPLGLLYMERERFEDVCKVLVQAANDVSIMQFLVGTVTIHAWPWFYFYLSRLCLFQKCYRK